MSDVLTPFAVLGDDAPGDLVPLPAPLAALYGPLRLPAPTDRPYILANFVTTLDGVVAYDMPERAGVGDISGHNAHDRALMGLLRALADAVIVGAGTLRAEPRHVWTPAHIFPALAGEYQALREALDKPQPPLTVLVTARGDLDLSWSVFTGGQAPVLLVTTAEGGRALRRQPLPPGVALAEVAGTTGVITAPEVIAATSAAIRQGSQPASTGPATLLVEGGPHLLGDFLAAQLLDEQFLTLAPHIAGRDGSANRPGLVGGHLFAPEHILVAQLRSVRRAGSHLFLRYELEGSAG
jgi:riboflavin biosynthesis pyrimidine reductase